MLALFPGTLTPIVEWGRELRASTDPDETSENVCVAEWNNCAYTISSLEFNARIQGTFLLAKDALSSGQVESISSLVRLGCHVEVRPNLEALVKFLRALTNFFLLQSSPSTEAPCILEIDCFTMMVNLHFTLTSLFASLSGATGNMDENSVMVPLMGITDECIVRICTAAQVLQYLLTYSPAAADGAPQTQRPDSSSDFGMGQALQNLWVKYRKMAGLPSDTPPGPYELYAGMQQHLYPFLQCSALFFHCLTSIDFVHSSGSLASRFKNLCSYLSLPPTIHSLFQPPPTKCPIDSFAQLWCKHPRLAELAAGPTLAPVLVSPRQLISLPYDFSDLMKKASAFHCPKQLVDRQYGDDGNCQKAMMCLVCGEMLCTKSYCCQYFIGEGKNAVRIGGLTRHVQSCSLGMGVALWILRASVVLLDATDVSNVKGCTFTPPYLDEYGEPDPEMRRGTPLMLNEDRYRDLQQIWFQHRIPEQIYKETESHKKLMKIDWSEM